MSDEYVIVARWLGDTDISTEHDGPWDEETIRELDALLDECVVSKEKGRP